MQLLTICSNDKLCVYDFGIWSFRCVRTLKSHLRTFVIAIYVAVKDDTLE